MRDRKKWDGTGWERFISFGGPDREILLALEDGPKLI